MRYLVTSVSDRWPNEMHLQVKENDAQLVEALYVRAKWTLSTSHDLPSLDPEPTFAAPAAMDAAQRSLMALEWDRHWSAMWIWMDRSHELELLGRRPDEIVGLLGFPPRWNDVAPEQAVGATELGEWTDQLRTEPVDSHDEPAVGLDHLVSAWGRGLSVIHVLPFSGHFAETRGSHAILVSRDTYRDPSALRTALSDFA